MIKSSVKLLVRNSTAARLRKESFTTIFSSKNAVSAFKKWYYNISILSIDHLALYCEAHPRKWSDYLPVGAIEVLTKKHEFRNIPSSSAHYCPHISHVAIQVSLNKNKKAVTLDCY